MKRILDLVFQDRIRKKKLLRSKNNLLFIDGNIALYAIKDSYISGSAPTPEMLVKYCNEIAEEYRSEYKVIVFDGLPPFQKLPEQLRRRKKRFNTFSDLSMQLTFDLANEFFIEFLDQVEELFLACDWEVISYKKDGEGEQKIADCIRSLDKYTTFDYNVIVWTKDWDMFIILLNMHHDKLPNGVHLYLKMNLDNYSEFIDINLCQVLLSDMNITTLHFSSIVMLFGCDFYPGIHNLQLTDNIFKRVLCLDDFVEIKADKVKVLPNEFNSLLEQLELYRLEKLGRSNIKSSPIGSSLSSNSSTDYNDNDIMLISYSNVNSIKVTIKSTDRECKGECIICNPNKFISKQYLIDSAVQYINLYLWTLSYFSGLLTKRKTDHCDNVYMSYISPTIKSLSWVISKWKESRDFHINIVHESVYREIIEQGLSLQYKTLPLCNYSPTYGDEQKIVSKEFKGLKYFRN